MSSTDPENPVSCRFLPRPLWIGTAAVVLIVTSVALHFGLGLYWPRGVVVVAQVADNSATQRLSLRYVRTGEGADSDSLVWETNSGQSWVAKSVITKRAFAAGSVRSRWISDIHSFDAQTGQAVIKVAEGDVPEIGSTSVHYIYSWREWDVARNRELRLIRVCESFDPFDDVEESDAAAVRPLAPE